MEILSQVIDVLPMFFVFGYVVAAGLTKDDHIKEIKYLMWAVVFLLSTIVGSYV